MTRWLEAAKSAREARTKLTKPTETAPEAPGEGVSSILSILSEGGGTKSAPAAPPPAHKLAPGLEAPDAFEERAAVREADGGQAREAAALAEVAQAAGMTPEALQRLWAAHPDARTYLRHLLDNGPATVGAAGSALGRGATRAWQAEARLRAAGLVVMGPLGQAIPLGARP